MTIVIVDSNIIFAALRSRNPKTRKKLANKSYKFYAPKFLFTELFKHKERIVKNVEATEEETLEFLSIILHHINFINEDLITTQTYIRAYNLCNDVDEEDTSFIALALTLNGKIWTRDIRLKKGLMEKGFTDFIDESNL